MWNYRYKDRIYSNEVHLYFYEFWKKKLYATDLIKKIFSQIDLVFSFAVQHFLSKRKAGNLNNDHFFSGTCKGGRFTQVWLAVFQSDLAWKTDDQAKGLKGYPSPLPFFKILPVPQDNRFLGKKYQNLSKKGKFWWFLRRIENSFLLLS